VDGMKGTLCTCQLPLGEFSRRTRGKCYGGNESDHASKFGWHEPAVYVGHFQKMFTFQPSQSLPKLIKKNKAISNMELCLFNRCQRLQENGKIDPKIQID